MRVVTPTCANHRDRLLYLREVHPLEVPPDLLFASVTDCERHVARTEHTVSRAGDFDAEGDLALVSHNRDTFAHLPPCLPPYPL